MKSIPTIIKGCHIFTPDVFRDNRGYFTVSYNAQLLKDLIGKDISFVQDNHSYSTYGVLRGLHFQKPPYHQTKLVRCPFGKVLDVVVDIDRNSETYGKHISVELSEDNMSMILVPNTCAHGFVVLSESAIFQYKVDNYYNKESEDSIVYNDLDLGIDWKIPQSDIVIADKDRFAKTFRDLIFD